MIVREVMEKNVISVSPDDSVGKALGEMKKYRLHQLLVMGDSLYGMIELKKMVEHDVDLKTAKVLPFTTKVPRIDANASIETAVELLLRSGLRALPVTDGGTVVGVISESDLIKVARQFVKGLNQTVKEIIAPAICVSSDSSYGQLKHLMIEKNVSRFPVLDDGKIAGIVSTFEFIKILEGKEPMPARGGRTQELGAKEKLRLEDAQVGAIMRQAVVVSGDTTVNDILDNLKSNDEVIVQDDGTFGVITPKDILELFASVPKRQLYVQITGMHNESVEFQVKMDQAVGEFVGKMGKMVDNIEYLVIHVEKMHKQGKKEKYSIRARFKVPFGFFVAHAWGWRPLDVIQEVFKNLESEIMKAHGKKADIAKMKRQKNRYR